ncbi:hypothetical protein M758_7G172000 [Ceratodon purpureus]|uniref:Uncharacterized protein n=1 Tax=Ceratodon purpureus TaxID=3225 RepID=A0A8T0HAP9_CERPU|nr:hypothetical protein KC19_7G174800 [Ceratodon purpureus]KAG0611871.1 hypothetical protein M758_7G172000 [Ceratodon purpureus]
MGQVVEMSQFGRLRVSGEDRIRFLHNQSTADFQKLKDGEGCDTVFVTSTGRTIDLARAWVMKNSVILFVSPSERRSLYTLLNKLVYWTLFFCVSVLCLSKEVNAVIGVERMLARFLCLKFREFAWE